MDNAQSSNTHPIPIQLQQQQWLRDVYRENYPKALLYLQQNNGSEEDAQDLFQEAFLVLWQQLESGRFAPENDSAVNGYLFRIVRNKWIDRLRSDKRRPVTALNEEQFADTPVTPPEDESRLQEINKRFQQLGDNCRQLLTLFYYRKQSMRAIATHFGWTEASAKNNKYRCLQQLKTLIS